MTIPSNARTEQPPRTEQARIVLVEDHSLFAESLEMALSIERYDASRVVLDNVPTAPTRLLAAIMRLKPRLVLLDLDLGRHGSGLDLIRPLSEAGVAVVVVTGNGDRARWGECIHHGARKVIPKSASLSEILASIRRISNGLPMMLPAEREELLSYWQRQVSAEKELRARLAHLTHREAEVLGMLMSGKQVGDIARERFVSESTVRTQVKSVLAKLQVGSQLTAVGLAHKANWTPPQDAGQGSAAAAASAAEVPTRAVAVAPALRRPMIPQQRDRRSVRHP